MANATININLNSQQAQTNVNSLLESIEQTRLELDKAIVTFGENSQEADNLRKSLAGLEVEMHKTTTATEETNASVGSLKSQLRAMTAELATLEPGSQRFVELTQRAGQLKDQIQDTTAVINAAAGSPLENLGKGFTSIAQLGVAGFQGVAGAMAMFGVESEKSQKLMTMLMGAMNVSQAITAFGQFGDTLTNIKASFTPILTQMGLLSTSQTAAATTGAAAATAITAEGTAATGAATATGFFGAALNALPLVAIISAIGLVVAGLVSYFSASEDATKADEARRKETEELNKKIYEENVALGESAGHFLQHIFLLKNTTANTKERKNAIDLVNKTYGTTFKNLKDEDKFQAQLNLSVKEYIALQVLKLKQQAKEKEEKAALGKLIKAQEDLNKVLNEYNASLDKNGKVVSKWSEKQIEDYDLAKYGVSNFNTAITKYTFELNQAQSAAESFAISQGDIQKEIDKLTNSGKKYVETSGQMTNSTNNTSNSMSNGAKSAKDYSSILDQINKILDMSVELEQENYFKRQELSTKVVLTKDQERVKIEENIKKIYEQNKLAIEKEIADNKTKNEYLKLNEENYFRYLQDLRLKDALDRQAASNAILKQAQDLNSYLLAESKVLQTEIRFGDGDTSDNKLKLYLRENDLYIKLLDSQIQRTIFQRQVDLDDFIDYQNDKAQALIDGYKKQQQADEEIAKSEYERLLNLEKAKYNVEKIFNIQRVADKNGAYQYEVTLIEGSVDAIKKKNEDEIKIETEKRDKLKKQIDGFNTQIEALNNKAITGKTNKEKEANRLKIESDKKEIENQKQLLETQLNTSDAKIQAIQNETNAVEKAGENQIKLQENLNETSLNLYRDFQIKRDEIATETNTNIAIATNKAEEDIFKERMRRYEKFVADVQSYFNKVNDIIQTVQDQNLQALEMNLDEYVNQENLKLQQQLENKIITQEEYDARVKQIEIRREQELLQMRRKQFNTDKALNIAGATMDAARATLSVFASTPGEFIIKSIAAALAAAFGAVQVGLIARQQFRANKGGVVPGSTMKNEDSVSSYLTPGEAVINRNSTQQFLPLLDMINRAGGGTQLMPDLPPSSSQTQRFQNVYSQQRQDPIRAYVVQSEIEGKMKQQSRIVRSTRF